MTNILCEEIQNIFTCDFCSKRFASLKKLNLHQNNVHIKSSSYPCELCNKSFDVKSNLKRHVKLTHRVKKSSKKFECPETGCSFAGRDSHQLRKEHIKLFSTMVSTYTYINWLDNIYCNVKILLSWVASVINFNLNTQWTYNWCLNGLLLHHHISLMLYVIQIQFLGCTNVHIQTKENSR